MEKKVVNLGTSLPVPCVQELATNLTKEHPYTIPARYIRSFHPDDVDQHLPPHLLNIQQEKVAEDAHDDDQLPVIDMHRLLLSESELPDLHYACKHWGFFQLVNHGVKISLLDKIKKQVQDFFNLPMEEKKKYWQYPGEVEGFGQAFVVSEDQKLDWGDIFYMVTQPSYARKPHLFPQLPLPLRETLDAYSTELKNLAMELLSKIAKALNLEEEEIRGIFEEGHQSMRINYYPPCPQPQKVIGLTPHSDAAGLTILLQLNDVEGLQIRKNGKWIAVKPLPHAFVINIGDVLEIMTNGAYRSIEHRATVNSEKERMSIATFCLPRYEAEIGPVPSLINPQNPAAFKRIGVEEYFKGLFTRKLQRKSYLHTLRI